MQTHPLAPSGQPQQPPPQQTPPPDGVGVGVGEADDPARLTATAVNTRLVSVWPPGHGLLTAAGSVMPRRTSKLVSHVRQRYWYAGTSQFYASRATVMTDRGHHGRRTRQRAKGSAIMLFSRCRRARSLREPRGAFQSRSSPVDQSLRISRTGPVDQSPPGPTTRGHQLDRPGCGD